MNVLPKVYLIGYTCVDWDSLHLYLDETEQSAFREHMAECDHLSDGEILCSFYAKLCYKSLTLGKNANLSKVRDIESNLEGVISSGHGSVLEHCCLNFVVTNCSRVFTHELVRHRVGTAFSQTSGRYVRSDRLDVVIDPILEPAYDLVEECRLYLEDFYRRLSSRLDVDNLKDFDQKKRITSAMRRMLPNGQANEIGFSVNLRALRHTIAMRTSPSAEWEIRYVFKQIYDLVNGLYPTIFADAVVSGDTVTFGNRV